MSRRKKIEYDFDPIAFEAQEKERLQYLESLFHPIHLSLKDIPLKWLVPNLIPRGYLVLIAADPKEGKTCLATALALAVACGTPFAGMPTQQAAVLWLSMEEGPHERRLLIRQSPLADPATPFYTCYSHIPIDTDEGIASLDHWIRQTRAGLIVVDPLHGAQSGRSLSDGWAARKTLKRLKTLCALHDVSALVLHHAAIKHMSNSKRVAESAQLAATASMEMVMTHRRIPLPRFEERKMREGLGEGDKSKGQPEAGTADFSRRASLKPPQPQTTDHRLQTTETRLITLQCKGRGDFANQTLYLISRGPLDYMRIDPESQTSQIDDKRNWLEQDLVDLLSKRALRSEQICDALKCEPEPLRSAITNLRRQRIVRIAWSKGEVRVYGLTKKAKNELANVARNHEEKKTGDLQVPTEPI